MSDCLKGEDCSDLNSNIQTKWIFCKGAALIKKETCLKFLVVYDPGNSPPFQKDEKLHYNIEYIVQNGVREMIFPHSVSLCKAEETLQDIYTQLLH